MTEKNKSDKMTNASKPVPMKLFAAWEVDRTPSNCIPRLCTLRITRLRVCGVLGEGGGGGGVGAGGGSCAGAGAVILAARMHSSKRTLRSNDIVIPPMDVELDLCFSLQYPHFVKRDGNRLQIMLQRRKKYKNRTILGYKTLAEGVIRMDQVLQRSMDMELELHAVRGKGGAGVGAGGGGAGPGGQPLARLSITGLASTPVDHDTKNNNTLLITERGYSDEEEEGEFSSMEEADDVTYGERARRRTHCRQLEFNKTDLSYTKLSRTPRVTLERDSDSELDTHDAKRHDGKISQRNLKQKFAALLRRFRVPEEMGERGAARDTHNAQRDIDELFQELESLSCGEDSGPEQMDTISIGSTPKPSLRPFFSSSRSLANQKHHRHSNVTRHASLTTASELSAAREWQNATGAESDAMRSSAGDERGSEGNSDGDLAGDAAASVMSSPPRDNKPQQIQEQLAGLLGADSAAAECVGVAGSGTGAVATALRALHVPTLCARAHCRDPRDLRALLHALYTRCNNQSHRRAATRLVVAGGDALTAAALRAHVDGAARRPLDAPPVRFHLVPVGANTISRQLAAADPGYAALFASESWLALTERGADLSPSELAEMSSRIARYINSIGNVNNMPIGEAMVAYREKSGDEDANQTFIPFVAEVRVGCSETGASLETEDGSPPARCSPPATPAPLLPPPPPPSLTDPPLAGLTPLLHAAEPMELQLDYWLAPGAQTEGGDSKVTIKASFRALHVTRQNAHLSITYLTKEKKQKIAVMRLGKKREKGGETEPRAQTVDGVARLICSARSHAPPLRVYIDGTEWTGVKFFQLSTQWQTHVKTFPVATSGAPLAPPES